MSASQCALAVSLAVAIAFGSGCQRRGEQVIAVSLPSGARFDLPVRAAAIAGDSPGDRAYTLADRAVLTVTEERMDDSCTQHVQWALDQAHPGADDKVTVARPPGRITLNHRSGVRIGLVVGDAAIQRIEMIGLCARSTFVIFQVAGRGDHLDPDLERVLVDTAASLRD